MATLWEVRNSRKNFVAKGEKGLRGLSFRPNPYKSTVIFRSLFLVSKRVTTLKHISEFMIRRIKSIVILFF